MSRTLTPDSTLDNLKKEAKRWLKALRDGDAKARERLAAATPAAPASPGLRDVQLALAREYGLSGWTALKDALDDLALSRRSRTELIDIVLRSAWLGDRVAAARILARYPDIRSATFYIATATEDFDTLKRRLAADPAAAKRRGGPFDWEPLLYLAYARLADADAPAIDIARLLLDHGANPNAQLVDDWDNPFTALTGVIGEGEGDKPPHPQALALATLLIERGANPFDTQALYNTSITRDDTTWLEFLWAQCEARGAADAWLAVPQPRLGGNVPLNALDYLLGNAVAFNHLKRAEWLVTHGANPNGVHAYSGRPLYEEALIHGHTAMAALLVRHGAVIPRLEGAAAFQAACMRVDRDAARTLADQHPECLLDASSMLNAARQGRTDVVALLLELGMNVDVADATEQRGIHNAVAGNALDVVKLLVAHGADIDRPTTRFGGAMGFAAHFNRREIAAFLAPLSSDVFELTYLGMKERLQELFDENPSLANAVHPRAGITPLFCLPDDEDDAVEMTEFLLARHASPEARNGNGETAEQIARKRGLIDAADLMQPDDAG